MSLIKQFEQDLDERVRAGELTESSKETYMNDASKVLEAVVALIPVEVLQAYVNEWGAKGDYRTTIRKLADIIRGRDQEA
jgi:hypothetical protein